MARCCRSTRHWLAARRSAGCWRRRPMARAAATLLCTFGDPAAAFGAIEAIQLTQLTPTAAEYLNSAALKTLDRSGSCALALRAEGLPQAVERHIAELSTLVARHGA